MSKAKNTKKTAKSTKVAIKAPVKSGKPVAPVKPVAKEAVVAAPKALSDVKQALNAAFMEKLPTARPIFQAKFKPLNLAAHTPTHATDRDTAFVSALRKVYGSKPFTQADSGADSGCLARAVALKLVTIEGTVDGKQSYKVAA